MQQEEAAQRIRHYRLKKAAKRTTAFGTGIVAGAIRGTLNISDFAVKNFTPSLSPKSHFMGTVDSLAGYFGGMTDHTVGDALLEYSLKTALIVYNLSAKTVRILNDRAEKAIKEDLILAGRKAATRQRA